MLDGQPLGKGACSDKTRCVAFSEKMSVWTELLPNYSFRFLCFRPIVKLIVSANSRRVTNGRFGFCRWGIVGVFVSVWRQCWFHSLQICISNGNACTAKLIGSVKLMLCEVARFAGRLSRMARILERTENTRLSGGVWSVDNEATRCQKSSIHSGSC
jgi:hypothetical protein